MGKFMDDVAYDRFIEYFKEYSFPFIVLDAHNIICDANKVFLEALKYTGQEMFGKMKITDITISASQKGFGLIKSSEFLNNKKFGISDFIALKQKSGKLKYFFFQIGTAGRGRKIIFLFEY
ncbi:MAG TPA: hypothetical protein PLA88_03420, partial [Bacteroidales bacterium]|nr:hypothetical protein [Bacteroidales bacterium]